MKKPKPTIKQMSREMRDKNLAKFSGQIDQPKYYDTPKFKNWFKDSPVIDESGSPLTVYHGGAGDVTEFDASRGKKTAANTTGASEGFNSFTDNPSLASSYAQRAGRKGANVVPAHLSMQNPYVIENAQSHWRALPAPAEMTYFNPKYRQNTTVQKGDMIDINQLARWAKDNGYDGLVVKNVSDPAYEKDRKLGLTNNYVTFKPNQVKSIFNSGEWNPNDPHISKARGGAVHMAQGGQVQRFDEGGHASLDQMRYELANSPVMQATPRSPVQDFIGTVGGYMDQTGNFIKDTLAPIAETNPRQHFLANMLLADPLKNAGTALQDYTGTVREADEDNPVRGIISKDWHNLTTSREPIFDPRLMDVSQFASPVMRGVTKLAGAGAKAAAPFASKVDDMVRELHASGAMPQPGLSIKDVTPKVLAPANEQGFYSPTEAAALNLQRKSGQGQAFLNDIMKGENVRPDEINAMGLDTFLKGKTNVTAAEVQDYIAKNKLGLGEARYGKTNSNNADYAQVVKDGDDYYIKVDGNTDWERPFSSESSAQAKVAEILDYYGYGKSEDTSKFKQYQLPGGTNYREVVLTLPTKVDQRGFFIDRDGNNFYLRNHDGKTLGEYGSRYEAQEAMQKNTSQDYKSSHWDDPNPLAHLRMSDRVTDGKKTLLVDEVQSDWHQAGREQGYKDPQAQEKIKQIKTLKDEMDALNTRRYELYAQAKETTDDDLPQFIKLTEESNGITNKMLELNKQIIDLEHFKRTQEGAIPNAPYKEDWYQLALRRAVKEAIDGGYDRVALPTGARVNERFDLSKQIDRIDYNKNPDGTYNMSAIKNGSEVFAKEGLDEKELSRIIGKDVAKKIVGDEGKAPTTKADRWEAEDGDVPEFKSLSGLDLQVGGEGNRKYYDEIYPGYLKKFGKKYGASVGKTTVDADGVAEPLHYMDITPAMRKKFSTGIHMKTGGNVQGNQMDQPLLSQYRMDATNHANPDLMDNIGVEEAIDMHPKVFMNPNVRKSGSPDVGGVSTAGGLPIGGVDQNAQQPGKQLMPEQPIQSQPQEGNQQGGLPDQSRTPEMGGAPTGPTGGAPTGAAPNLLSMTPQGQKMQAMGSPLAPNAPAGMAKGGKVENQSTRITIPAEGFGGVKGITVPRHMWEGKVYGGTGPKAGQKVEGMRDINKARAKVYGSEPREPLKIGQVGRLHKDILNEHFGLPIEEQMAREEQALEKLRKSKHIGANADTLDTSEKLDTVRHEYDEEGRPYEGFASKGVAGYSLYTSGHGKEAKHITINTCPGATVGCSGGVDKNGVADTSKGTCFASHAEQQYVNAAVRRAAHEQAKHDPAMTKDWILAHTGALRKVSNDLDKKNVRTLFRPNVVDETDVSSRHVIKGLNDQRKAQGKPIITANSYGKTNELNDPENGYHVTHSNVGPKTKHGQSIQENIDRDKQRVRNTILAANARGEDFENEEGNKTPPKGSYMVTNVRRGSPHDQAMQKAIKYAKYWSTGRPLDELTEAEKAEGDEAHYGGDHEPTTRAKAHYGHVIHKDKRYDYQNQHILHPRFVQVGMNDDGSPHMIPTDSRFKDEDFLPKKRFMTRNGKKAGYILMTTPTNSTPFVERHSSFTHDVNEGHIEHAKKKEGEYEIDPPAAQEASAGKEYVPPQPIKIVRKAEGGSIHHHHLSEDHMAFPEQSFHAQEHNAHRIGIESIEDMPEHVIHKHYRSRIKAYPAYRPPVTADTMRIELMAKGKDK
jgi:hypothetical protein